MSAAATDWHALDPAAFTSEQRATMTELPDRSILVTGDRPTRDTYTVAFDTDLTGITAFRLEAIPDTRLPHRGPGRGSGIDDGNFMLTELTITAAPAAGGDPVPLQIVEATADYHGQFSGNAHKPEHAIDGDRDTGWSILGETAKPHHAVFRLGAPAGFEGGTKLTFTLLHNFIDQHTLGRFRVAAATTAAPVRVVAGLSPAIESILAAPPEWRNADQRERLRLAFLRQSPRLADENARIAALEKQIPEFTTALMLDERDETRPTHLHVRGEFLNLGDGIDQPAVPALFPPLPPDQPANRLTLARWIVSEDNPLTARVLVNRVWQQYFGRGLVHTTEDFGLQGEPPSHPDLLDWLATEFIRQGWSLKAVHRLIVTSATYRQDSKVSDELLERDPYNVLLARGPRFRVSAEVIRDLALRAGGLLTTKVGGPSVFPPQPDGVTSLSYGPLAWNTSAGDDRYRRGLYTFWKRTAPYASLAAFGAPSRESCIVQRVRSNTPLQALALLNDPVFTEAAQALARRIIEESPADPAARIDRAFRLCLSRPPDDAERDRLQAFLHQQIEHFAAGAADPAKLVPQDAAKELKPDELNELAAWTVLANLLLNLDETITKG